MGLFPVAARSARCTGSAVPLGSLGYMCLRLPSASAPSPGWVFPSVCLAPGSVVNLENPLPPAFQGKHAATPKEKETPTSLSSIVPALRLYHSLVLKRQSGYFFCLCQLFYAFSTIITIIVATFVHMVKDC